MGQPFGSLHAVIALRSDHEHRELAASFPLSLDIARGAGAEVREVTVPGRGARDPPVARDDRRLRDLLRRTSPRRDPTPVEVIQGLKAALAAMDLG